MSVPEGDFEYTPDMLVVTQSDEIVFIECKPREVLEQPEVKERMSIINAFLVGHGARFLTCDESVIEVPPILENINKLMRHRRIALDADQLSQYRQDLHRRSLSTFGELLEAVPSYVALHALANGWFYFDFNQRLCKETALFLNWKGEYDAASFMESR
jgi:hypothetical protein